MGKKMLNGLDVGKVPTSKPIQNKDAISFSSKSFQKKSKQLTTPPDSAFLGGDRLQFNKCIGNPYHLKSAREDMSEWSPMLSPDDKDMEYDW